MDIRNILRYLGVPLCEKDSMFGENEYVVNSTFIRHTKLHKQHIALSSHRVRAAITAGVVPFKFLAGKDNPANVLSK